MTKIYKFLALSLVILVGSNMSASAQIYNFSFTGSVQAWTVPPGIFSITVAAQGATGGKNSSVGRANVGGNGGCAQATFAVTPGQVINIHVGGKGSAGVTSTGGAGGYNGGGNGAAIVAGDGGGGGGGESDIVFGVTPMLIAGGGGGAGSECIGFNAGGDGGTLTGATGGAGCTPPPITTGGGGGAGITGGIGGTCGACAGVAGFPGTGYFGAAGAGGAGGTGSPGGGGGGGYAGGGGGQYTGGGGGSSYIDVSGTATSMSRGCNSGGNGTVSITAICAPGVVTASPAVFCAGTTSSVSDPVAGGTWSSGNTAIVTVDSSTGIVTGVTGGTAVITYNVGPCTAFTTVTINPLPSMIAPFGICLGNTTTLTDSISGGTWTSSNTSVANIGLGTGTITTGITGTSTITYTAPATGCVITTVVTVNPLPTPILGWDSVCVGVSTTLSDAGGGTWGTSNLGVASIGTSTGIIAGLSAGTTIDTYTLPTGCFITSLFTVNPLPSAISGTMEICAGTTSALTDVGGGTWSSSNTTVASIDGTGFVTTFAISPGTATITYTLPTGCVTTSVFTADALPDPITGPTDICAGSTATYVETSGGGIWSEAGLSSITSGGVATAGPATIATVSYQNSTTGCEAFLTVTVSPLPAGITGPKTVCTGQTIVLSDASAGTWSISNTSATIGISTGVVAGISSTSALDTVTYTTPPGCTTTYIILVNPLAPITGNFNVCRGGTTTLSDSVSGGIWSSSNTAVATIDTSLGIVNGLSSGTSSICYTTSSGCTTCITVTVNPLTAIIGNPNVCLGTPNTLSDPNAGGTWTSGNTLVATVGSSSGIVTGISTIINAGVDTITYTLGTGCSTTFAVTVDPTPSAIIGPFSVCSGLVTCLSDTTAGGVWSSGNLLVGVIGSATGCVTGLSQGTATVTYKLLSTGCLITNTVVVNPLPGNINGNPSICLGLNTTLTDATLGGTWSSSITTVATIAGFGATVIVHGTGVGTSTITYTLPTGCITIKTVTVNPLPVAISGTFVLCGGSSTILSDGTGGGNWTSSNTSASIGFGTGLLTGSLGGGTDTITYKLSGTGCLVTATVLVNPLSPITGGDSVCNGDTLTLHDATGSGTWSSSNISVATIGSISGFVTGLTAGTSTICFTTVAGCKACITFSVNPLPPLPTGSSKVCETQSETLSDAIGGGIWTTSSTSITVGSSSGLVTGIGTGAATVTYTLSTGCSVTFAMAIPPLGPIKGTFSVCPGDSVTLSDSSATVGTWTSSNTLVATVGSISAVVTGVITTGATAIISYTTTDGCIATHTFTVNPTPGPILGTYVLCAGQSTKLTDGGSGTWSSSNTAVATINSGGTWTAVDSVDAIITYTLPTGCINVVEVFVNPNPPAITGVSEICQGSMTTLSDATGGGTWTSTLTTVATIGSTGIVDGTGGGTTTIIYTFTTTGCSTSFTETVDPVAPITGVTSTCIGLTTPLTDAIGPGTWASSNTSVATIDVSGVVTGQGSGTATITYTLSTGCTATTTVTIFALPNPITGITTVCQGATITLSDDITGGTWTSSTSSVAIITTSSIGVVTGKSGGTSTITYTLGTGCYVTQTITVNPVTPILSPPFTVCIGSSITLSDATTSGTWSSGDLGVATIDSTLGILNTVGVVGGTSTITYSLPGGCSATQVVTVNPLPANITGPTEVCVGSQITLHDISGTTTWSVLPGTVANIIPTTGVLTGGLLSGIATVTFKLATGCSVNYTVTVNPLPTPILGGNKVCVGGSVTLSDATAGGTWLSTVTSVATIGSLSGLVSSSGTLGSTTIIYTLISTGCSISELFTVNPFPSPITGPNEVCGAGSTITLRDVDGPGTWIGDPPFATVAGGGFSTTVTGGSAGIATIQYTVTSTGCTASYVVTVLPIPSALITPLGDTNICAGGFVALTATTGLGLTYQWYMLPGPAIIPGAVTSSYIATPGVTTSYEVVVSSGLTGCNATSAPMMVVVTPFTSSITSTSTSVCTGTSVTFTALPAGDSYQWQLSGVPIPGATAQNYTTTVAGDYTAVVSTGTGCSATSNLITLLTNPLPSNIVTVSGPLVICAGSNVIFNADTGSGYTYQWYKGGVLIAGSTDRADTATTAGAYKVVVTNIYGCSSTSASFTVTVNPLPVAPTITAGGPKIFCAGGNVSLVASSISTGITYQWYDGGVPIVGAVGSLFLASTSGIYSALITTSLTCGSFTASDTVVVVLQPGIKPLTTSSFCWGGNSDLSVTIVGGAGAVTYQWENGTTPIPGATNNTYDATVSGSYSCIVTVIGAGGSAVCSISSNKAPVTEFPLPDPLVTIDTTGTLFKTGNFFVTYQWYKNLTAIPGAISFTTPITGNADYKVAVTDTNGCQSVSDIYVLTGWTGAIHGVNVQNVNGAGTIKIYPNPAQTMVHIESPQEVRAVISAMDGRMIIDQPKAKDIDITNLADGIYMIMVYDENGIMVKTEKLVKAAN